MNIEYILICPVHWGPGSWMHLVTVWAESWIHPMKWLVINVVLCQPMSSFMINIYIYIHIYDNAKQFIHVLKVLAYIVSVKVVKIKGCPYKRYLTNHKPNHKKSYCNTHGTCLLFRECEGAWGSMRMLRFVFWVFCYQSPKIWYSSHPDLWKS